LNNLEATITFGGKKNNNRAGSLSYTGGCKQEKSFPVKIENYFIFCVRKAVPVLLFIPVVLLM